MINRQEMQIKANIAAKRILRAATLKVPIGGWTALLDANILLEINTSARDIPEQKLTSLLKLAKSEPLAFQAAKALAAEQVAAGEPVAPSLRNFISDVLSEKVERPKQQGNRPRDDVLLRVMQYVLIRKVASDFGVSIASGERTPSSKTHMPSACEIVAEAFSIAGKHTTKAQMKSLVYDANADHLRKLGDWAMI